MEAEVSRRALERVPVTVTADNLLPDPTNTIFRSVILLAVISISLTNFFSYPTAENSNSYFLPAGKVMVYNPSPFELTPPGAPTILTETPERGSFLSFNILPDIFPVCAKTEKDEIIMKKMSRYFLLTKDCLIAAKVSAQCYRYITPVLSNCFPHVNAMLPHTTKNGIEGGW